MRKQEGDRYFHSTQITGIPLISNVTICLIGFVVCGMQKQPHFSAGFRKQLLKGILKGLFYQLNSPAAHVD